MPDLPEGWSALELATENARQALGRWVSGTGHGDIELAEALRKLLDQLDAERKIRHA